MFFTLLDIKKIKYTTSNDKLSVIDFSDVTLPIRRIFSICANNQEQRGKHAHKQLTQILYCLSGSCEVTVDDGNQTASYQLDRSQAGLLIPPSIWASQLYLEDNTVLQVLCDMPYDESDYIRDYHEFLNYRKQEVLA